MDLANSLCLTGSHEHTQCRLVTTINKVRVHAQLSPLTFVNGRLSHKDTPVLLDVQKEVRSLKEAVALLRADIEKLKAPRGAPLQGGKHKAEKAPVANTVTKKRKRGGKGKGGQPQGGPQQGGGQPQASGSGQSQQKAGGGKGKGKQAQK